jgi:FkbM family methyltransferase
MVTWIRSLLNKIGLDLIRSHNNHSSLEFHLGNIFAKKSIDCVLDVGANAGQYGASLRKLGYDGWIVSFEPVLAVFNKLVDYSRDDNRWICYNVALGDKAELKNINVYSSTVFSSFLNANDYSKGIWKSLNNVLPEQVKVVRLDDLFVSIQEKTGCQHFYLKLDTQGYDLNVFQGSFNSLDSIDAMQTELSLIHVYEGMLSPYAMLEQLHKRDYFISGMYPINRDDSLAIIEYDCVLVKKLPKADERQ